MKGKKLRPLHLPSPVAVRADARGRPVAVGPSDGSNERGSNEVVQIREIWRIDDEWWREPLSRLYFEVILEDGKRAILYRDLNDGRWYRQ